MSQTGELRLECDNRECEAEQFFTPEQLQDEGLRSVRYAHGWRYRDGKDVCPQCVEAENDG